MEQQPKGSQFSQQLLLSHLEEYSRRQQQVLDRLDRMDDRLRDLEKTTASNSKSTEITRWVIALVVTSVVMAMGKAYISENPAIVPGKSYPPPIEKPTTELPKDD